MNVTVIGTGFIGGTLGRVLAGRGHQVTFGSRHPESDDVAGDSTAAVASIGASLAAPDVIILALPGGAVAGLAADHASALSGRLVIDATNQLGAAVANARADLPAGVRYGRAFNTLGGENMADPAFADGPADMFFSGPEQDRAALETVIADVGLRPVYVGADEEATIDALFHLWIALAVTQGRGRRLALRLLEG
jgi:8-hydroxy-5-deazaflavin:NADPH oxidoreductase